MKNRRIKLNKTWLLFGFLNDGLSDDSFVDSQGDRWFTDEYGDMAHMWDYR